METKIAELEAKIAELEATLAQERKERAELVDKMEQLLVFAKAMKEQRDGAMAIAKKLTEDTSSSDHKILLQKNKIILPM